MPTSYSWVTGMTWASQQGIQGRILQPPPKVQSNLPPPLGMIVFGKSDKFSENTPLKSPSKWSPDWSNEMSKIRKSLSRGEQLKVLNADGIFWGGRCWWSWSWWAGRGRWWWSWSWWAGGGRWPWWKQMMTTTTPTTAIYKSFVKRRGIRVRPKFFHLVLFLSWHTGYMSDVYWIPCVIGRSTLAVESVL